MLKSIKNLFKSSPEAEILIIEDNPTTQATLREILETQNVNIKSAFKGEDAFDLLKTGYFPDVIILDLHLPKMSGVDVMKKLRADPLTKKIPIVTFSSTVDEATNKAYSKDVEIVNQYMKSLKEIEQSAATRISPIIPKYKGQEGVEIIHPQLIVCVAAELLRKKIELTAEFKTLLRISQKHIGAALKK